VATTLPISVAIPTYRRESVLLDTLDYLLALEVAPAEILVLDQTEQHALETELQLSNLHSSGRIRWLRLDTPSIPRAMNHGLLAAREHLVLFVDDDIRPEPDLVSAHFQAHQAHADTLVAGRVIQPWQEGKDVSTDRHFHFACLQSAWIGDFIGCNFSLPRDLARALGGFDENFVRVAFRFEAEFAHRFLAAGSRIRFEPAACLHHLKTDVGGTRTFGEHLTTWRPDHAVGAYYFALRTRSAGWCALEFIARPVRAVATRHHLRHPWWIPLTWFAEIRGMAWALALAIRGPRLLDAKVTHA
jgi:GT2 family glycosyltransferase